MLGSTMANFWGLQVASYSAAGQLLPLLHFMLLDADNRSESPVIFHVGSKAIVAYLAKYFPIPPRRIAKMTCPPTVHIQTLSDLGRQFCNSPRSTLCPIATLDLNGRHSQALS